MLGMEHFEIHIVSEPDQIALAVQAGLLDFADDLRCEHCDEVVGIDLDEFYPFGIVLNSFDEVWFVCDECFTPVIDPQAI